MWKFEWCGTDVDDDIDDGNSLFCVFVEGCLRNRIWHGRKHRRLGAEELEASFQSEEHLSSSQPLLNC